MPFNVYLNDELVQTSVSSPHALTGLNPATEYKLSVTEVIKDIESPKWNGKLLTKAIVSAETIAFIQSVYDVIEGDSMFAEPLTIPWNTTNRDKLNVQLIENDGVLALDDEENSIVALKVGKAKISPVAEFVANNAELIGATINVLPKETPPRYPTKFGIGSYISSGPEAGTFTNELYITQYDTSFIQFGVAGDPNKHDWVLEAIDKDLIRVGSHGRRVTGLKVGVAKANLYYKSNPSVKVEVTIHVTDEPSDFIFDSTQISGKIAESGQINIKYIPQATVPSYPLYISNRSPNIVRVTADTEDPTKLNYEFIGLGLAQVRVSCGNSTRILFFTCLE